MRDSIYICACFCANHDRNHEGDVDPEKTTNAEFHAHFTKMLVGRTHDMDTRLGDVDSKLSDAMEKIDGLEEAFNAKLNTKFQEVLAQLPPQPGIHAPRVLRVPIIPPPVGTVTAAAVVMEAATQDGYAADKGEDEFEDENKLEEGEFQQHAPGRPQQ
jgi:hypothetical protein